MEKSYTIADLGYCTVEQGNPIYMDNLKAMERERKNQRKKEDRQATIGAYLGCFLAFGIFALMLTSYFLIGYIN
mgnify:FL=1